MGRLKRRFKASGVPCPSVPLWEGGRAPGPGLRPARGQAPLDGEGIFVISHALPLPRCLSALAVGLLVVHGSLSRPGCAGRGTMGSGKTGGRRLAHLTICATSRPAGDFRSRLFRCSPPVSRLHRCNALRRLCPRYRRGLCAFIRRAGVIVPPGEPPDRTSPAARLRLPRGGGAGPSPHVHRRERRSRGRD
jgi:hypothetical protein